MWFGDKLIFNSLPGNPQRCQLLTDEAVFGPGPSGVGLELYGDDSARVEFQSFASGNVVIKVDKDRLLDKWRRFFDPIPPSPVVTLDIKEVGRKWNGCGDFEWTVEWVLRNASEFTNGFIVQRIKSGIYTDIFGSEDADGNVKIESTEDEWWEAFLVRKGQVLNSSNVADPRDQYRITNTFADRGSSLVAGEAKYLDGYTLPFRWKPKGAKGAGTLRSTTTAPPDWSRSGTLYRAASIQQFDCWNGKNTAGPIVIEITRVP